MGKLEYLDALKRAMTGLAPELQAKTLAYYEQRFVDGLAAGRSEPTSRSELDDPKKIAMTLRASSHLARLPSKNAIRPTWCACWCRRSAWPSSTCSWWCRRRSTRRCWRRMYACALAFYVAGIAITASGLSGANELVLDGPLRHFVISDDDDARSRTRQTKVTIDETGIASSRKRRPSRCRAPPQADSHDDGRRRRAPVIKRAEAVAGRGIRISTDMDADSRTTQTVFGLCDGARRDHPVPARAGRDEVHVVGIKRYIANEFFPAQGQLKHTGAHHARINESWIQPAAAGLRADRPVLQHAAGPGHQRPVESGRPHGRKRNAQPRQARSARSTSPARST